MIRRINEAETSSPLAVVYRLNRKNRYSFIALTASLENFPQLRNVPIFAAEWPNREDLRNDISCLLNRHRQLLIAYSFMTPQWEEAAEEVEWLSAHPARRSLFLVAGGAHPSGAPRLTVEAGFDVVCVGEGEEAFPKIVFARLQNGCLERVPGLYLKNDSKALFTGRQPRIDISQVRPLPLRQNFFGPLEITRGCPYGCKYCQTPILKGKKIRHRGLECIFEAVEKMVSANRTDIRFISPNALCYGSSDGLEVDLASLHRLLSGIRRRLPPNGRIFFGSFPSEVRPEFVSEESARLLKEFCDNKTIVIGAQSGSGKVLERMRRGHRPDAVYHACEILVRKGFRPAVDFILGLPGESDQEMEKTLSFMEALATMGVRIHAHAFVPLPGTPWAPLAAQPIPKRLRERLEHLISRGKLFGQWKKQENIAQHIARLSISRRVRVPQN